MRKRQKRLLIIFAVAFIALMAVSFIDLFTGRNTGNTTEIPDSIAYIHHKSLQKLNLICPWDSNSGESKILLELLNDFEFLNQDIHLNIKYPDKLTSISPRETMANLIIKMINKGIAEWDIIWLDDSIYNLVAKKTGDPLWGQKNLVNFIDVKGFGTRQKPFIIDNPVYKQQTGNIYAGPFLDGFYNCLWYNKVTAKMLDIEIKNTGMLVTEFIEYLRIVKEFNDKYDAGLVALYADNEKEMASILFQRIYHSHLFDIRQQNNPDNQTSRFNALYKTLVSFRDISKYKPLLQDTAHSEWLKAHNLAVEQKALFYAGSTKNYLQWKEKYPDRFHEMIPVELPVIRPIETYPGDFRNTFAVIKNSPNKAAAFTLIRFISDPKTATWWSKKTKNPTGIRSFSLSDELRNDLPGYFQNYITDTYKENIIIPEISYAVTGKLNKKADAFIAEKLVDIMKGLADVETSYKQIIDYLSQKTNY